MPLLGDIVIKNVGIEQYSVPDGLWYNKPITLMKKRNMNGLLHVNLCSLFMKLYCITIIKGKVMKTFITALSLFFLTLTNPLLAQQWWNVGTAGFSTSRADYTSIAIDGNGTPYVAYKDYGNSYKATVMKYDGNNWVNVGSAGFSAGEVSYTSIAIDGNGTPYVAYEDWANSIEATVMKYNGSNWVNVGSAGFSAFVALYPSIAIDGSGTPYVAYLDWGNLGKATVMKYNGSNWVNVGLPGFSAGQAYNTTIAIDGSGTPYVAYSDYADSNKATVMKYTGSNWINVGSAGFSAGTANHPTIALDGSGTPYVAYSDGGKSGKATVMKYDGNNWVNVGSAGFSDSSADNTSIAIDGNGTPYVVYGDGSISFNATVMKYNGSNWVNVGSSGFSAGEVWHTTIAFDGSGTPYVAYRDEGNSDKATVMKYSISIPVELESFSVFINGNDTLIEWQTATEVNNLGFEVQRLEVRDQKPEWEKIGFVKGNGTSTVLRRYSYLDKAVSSGKYLYRLKQIDNDGGYKYSKEVEITINKPVDFSLSQNYPNPFNPTTKIKYNIPAAGNVTIKVFDVLGKEIKTLVEEYKAAGSYEVDFNANELPSGVYFYRIAIHSDRIVSGSFSETKKMVLMR